MDRTDAVGTDDPDCSSPMRSLTEKDEGGAHNATDLLEPFDRCDPKGRTGCLPCWIHFGGDLAEAGADGGWYRYGRVISFGCRTYCGCRRRLLDVGWNERRESDVGMEERSIID